MELLEKIKLDLKKSLSEYRYGHSLRVAEEARKLATIYGVDRGGARLVEHVHDVAKEFDENENMLWISQGGLSNDLLKEEFKKIRHAEIGAVVAKNKYHLADDICQAIRYHTVGNVEMTLLDKIVFVADKIESGKDYPGIEEERVVAYQDIDASLILCLENQKFHVERQGKKFHVEALRLLEFLKNGNVRMN